MSPTRRSYEPLTDDDLRRLEAIAVARHDEMARDRPDWCSTLIAACLVQGGARHRVNGDRGIKDLDVYLFYALGPGASAGKFPFNRGTIQRDFGSSHHGQELYTDEDRLDPGLARRIPKWEQFVGRRVDLLARAIPPHSEGARAAVVDWLRTGQDKRGSTPWHLAQTPVVALRPGLGDVWWEGPAHDTAGHAKGAYDADR